MGEPPGALGAGRDKRGAHGQTGPPTQKIPTAGGTMIPEDDIAAGRSNRGSETRVGGGAGQPPDPPYPSTEGDFPLERYLEALDSSSARTRWVIILITVASILAFFAHWNTRSDGWLKGRVTVAQDAKHLLLVEENVACELLTSGDEKWRRAQLWLTLNSFGLPEALRKREGNAHPNAKPESTLPIVGRSTSREHRVAGDSTATRTSQIELIDITEARMRVQEVQRYIDMLYEKRLEHVIFVDIPFLGVMFDVNDLGIFSGVTFLVLLVMLRFCAQRELYNLCTVLSRPANRSRLAQIYPLLSMHQVLTVPRNLAGDTHTASTVGRCEADADGWVAPQHPLSLAWRVAPRVACWAPALVHSAILLNDMQSLSHGMAVSPLGVWIGLGGGSALLFCIISVSAGCDHLFRSIDCRWDAAAEHASRLSRQGDAKYSPAGSRAGGADAGQPHGE